jgi:hypothetical protein
MLSEISIFYNFDAKKGFLKRKNEIFVAQVKGFVSFEAKKMFSIYTFRFKEKITWLKRSENNLVEAKQNI